MLISLLYPRRRGRCPCLVVCQIKYQISPQCHALGVFCLYPSDRVLWRQNHCGRCTEESCLRLESNPKLIVIHPAV